MAEIVVTGTAGFIGYHVAERLLADGHAVAGVDVVNDYYDPKLKRARLARLAAHPDYRHFEIDLADRAAMAAMFDETKPTGVVHLAAQAGVRYSLTHPEAYIESNLVGFNHILEGCRAHTVGHLVYASSSSVYGANTAMPFSEHSVTAHPVSLYAATKKSNELMAHAYASLFGVPCTGLRFFTVYGPWGRPDMAMFLFTEAILAGRPIDVFNMGDMRRDFTYIDDVVEGVVRVLQHPASPAAAWSGDNPDPATSFAPFRVFNIGANKPVELMEMIRVLETTLGTEAKKNLLPMQPGDVMATWADSSELIAAVGYSPSTPLDAGIRRFVAWYLDYYGVTPKG
jgi:UDP-glucuronate 4-epimerase